MRLPATSKKSLDLDRHSKHHTCDIQLRKKVMRSVIFFKNKPKVNIKEQIFLKMS